MIIILILKEVKLIHEKTLTKLGSRDNPVHITSLESYGKCPKKFQMQLTEEAEEPKTPIYLVGGTALHDSIMEIMRNNWTIPISKWKNIEDLFMDKWSQTVAKKTQYAPLEGSKETIKNTISNYIEMITNFIEREKPLNRIKPIWSEIKYILEIPGWKSGESIWISGMLDLIAEINGKLSLLDWKSNKQKPTDDELLRKLQFSTYAIAMKRGTFFDYTDQYKPFQINQFPEAVFWYHLRANEKYQKNQYAQYIGKGKNKKQNPKFNKGYKVGDFKGEPLIFTPRYEWQEKAVFNEIHMRLKAIQNEIFFMEANPIYCKNCNFRDKCQKNYCNKKIQLPKKTVVVHDDGDII